MDDLTQDVYAAVNSDGSFGRSGGPGGKGFPPPLTRLPQGMVAKRQSENPRDNVSKASNPDDLTFG